ncbi:MAG TPA: hemerythrin domain-containing protein [Candidatus Thermoplasmatota archaeon]|nr:hemerythrin domain-containing protein [Candidatus Thermoplasmatota archaeon]
MSTPTRLEPSKGQERPRRLAISDPLAILRAEHARLQEAVSQIDWLLSQRSLSPFELEALQEAVRLVRTELSPHLVKEEFALYPEIASADPTAALALPELKAGHMLVEDDFAQLQALVLAFAVGLGSPAMRRKAAKASRKLRDDLSAVVAREEAEAFAAAQRGLNAEAMGRLRGAMEAAETRARLKAGQLR